MTATTWAAEFRTALDNHHAAGTLTDYQRNLLLDRVNFAEQHGVAFADPEDRLNLWGFGEIRPTFASLDGKTWWCCLSDLQEPSGLDYPDLYAAWEAEKAMDYGDCAEMIHTKEDGDQLPIPMLSGGAVLRIMMFASVWAAEMQRNLYPAFRRGIVDSGLGDTLGPVVIVDQDGSTTETVKTFTEFMVGNDLLLTAEEAVALAFSGPSGAIARERP